MKPTLPSLLTQQTQAWIDWCNTHLDTKRMVLILLLLASLIVLAGHHLIPPVDRDEARFAQASRQMAETQDYIVVRFQDELRAKKPAGIYWLQSLSAQLFSLDNIAAYRLPSLLGYLSAIFLTWHLYRDIFRPVNAPDIRRGAFLAAAMMASALIVFAEAHLAKTDSVLLALCLLQQFLLWRIYRDRKTEKPARWLGFWCVMGLGILVKGPIAPALAALTFIGLSVLDRDMSWWRRLRPFYGIGLVGLITLPWALAVQLVTDGAFLSTAVGEDFLPKLKSGQESHGAPPGTYLLLLPILLFPASLFIGRLAILRRASFKSDGTRFLFVWLIGYWVMVELIPTKLPHYVLPALPALFCLMAAAITAPLEKNWRLGIEAVLAGTTALMMLVFFGLLGWAASQYGGQTGGRAFLAVIAGLCLLCWLFWATGKRLWAVWQADTGHGDKVSEHQHISAIWPIFICGIGLQFLIFSGVFAHLQKMHISSQLKSEIAQIEPAPTNLALAGYHEPSAVFLLGRDSFLLKPREAALFLAEAPGAIALIETRAESEFLTMAQDLSLRLEKIRTIEGFNISRGQEISVHFYRKRAFDAAQPEG